MKQDFESARPGPSTGVMPQHALREAMKRADVGDWPGRAIGLNAVEAATSVPTNAPSLNHVADELDRLDDRLDDLINISGSMAQSLDAAQIEDTPPWPTALDGKGVVPRLANRLAGIHHKVGIVRGLLNAAGRAI